MKISKFGGSSVADAGQIKKVVNIINSDPSRRVIVVSAPGKRSSNDVKVTDLLITLYDKVTANIDYNDALDAVLKRFESIIDDLSIHSSLIDKFRIQLTDYISRYAAQPERLMDALKSSGEDFNAQVIAEYNQSLGHSTIYLSPKDIGLYVTDEPSHAMVLNESYAHIQSSMPKDTIVIMPGFFGYSLNHDIVTFSRGGSDLTGAIMARALDAELYENFTDVSGIFSANPTLIDQPKPIEILTYDEMRELAYGGFNVFHEEAFAPLYGLDIPVAIKNTNRPDDKGTLIVADHHDKGVVGITCEKDFSTINIKKYLMNREIGFTRRLLSILEKYDVSYEQIPSGIDNISVIVRTNQLTGKKEDVLQAIRNELHPNELTVENHIALLMIVGAGMKTTVGTANKATSVLAREQINIKMISQGSSEISMMFAINDSDADKALKAVYQAFFS